MKTHPRLRMTVLLAAIAAVIVVWGQGCGKASEDETLNSLNNGGGYGGLVIDSSGQYGGTTPTQEGEPPLVDPDMGIDPKNIIDSYYRRGTPSFDMCSNYLRGWDSVAHSVLEVIVRASNGRHFIHQSVCGDPPEEMGDEYVDRAAYNPDVIVVEEQIFLRAASMPVKAADILDPVVFCRAKMVNASGVDEGVDVLITRTKDDGLEARMDIGRAAGMSGTRLKVKPFSVRRSMASRERFFAPGFDLRVDYALGAATGDLNMVIDGIGESRQLVCWRHRD